MILDKLEPVYDATLRRVKPVHSVLREVVWSAGDAMVRVVSTLTGFELPPDRLLPLYKLQFLLGTYERGTVRAVRGLLRPGMTAIDVGAHAGYYTLLFSRLVGATGRVLACEPHPATFAVLSRNARRRRLANVRLFPSAVSDREGPARLWQTELSVGHSLLPVKQGALEALTVTATTLDALSRAEGIARADLVKVDVEGGEAEVLTGMAELAARSPGLALILEYKPEILRARGEDLPSLVARLAAHGFEDVWALSNSSPPRRVDARDASLRTWPKCNLLARRRLRRGGAGVSAPGA
ncbi:MAG TPA: FkbM family methyltransferase [Vicinamibacteria bacterium]|nr:FkbM family methyltransferase [Vicinamibacteria bacterium]